MHAPKITTFDVPARVNIDTKGMERAVDEYRQTSFGLYMSRPMINRPTAHWVETWLLPDLGLAVTDWWWNPGHTRDQDFYLDVCEIVRDGDRWVLTDYYLDIVVQNRRSARLIDIDEFVAAVSLGLLAPPAAEQAMHIAYRTIDGLAANGHDLDAWLAEMGITLAWKERPTGPRL
jgi:predicted RNA-binding protein associated with RNAse of E/G family